LDRDKIKVLIASKNPIKINAVSSAFKHSFSNASFVFIGEDAPSKVSDQPMSEKETKTGCKNRLFFIEKNFKADYYVSIEGGVDYDNNRLFAFAWVYIKSKKFISKSKTSIFQLPQKIKLLVEGGVELGEADDIVFNRKNSKKKDGAVGLLTKGVITRESYYKEAIVLGLIPFMNKDFSF